LNIFAPGRVPPFSVKCGERNPAQRRGRIGHRFSSAAHA
jgi:hypothetical protein